MDTFETVAREAVGEASVLLRAAAQRSKTIEYKGPVDLVTESDREIEAVITERLRRAFPTHVIVAEEASAQGTLRAPPPDQYAWYTIRSTAR